MTLGHWGRGALIVAALDAVSPLMTWAADVPPPGADTLEEVIVTAQRRAERALDVADSISVLSAADIERLHATNLQDLAAAAPGLVIVSGGTPGQATVVLRGLSPFNGENLVTTLIDESAAGGSSLSAWTGDIGFDLDMLPYDVERIEILRGPQGTLYGANSIGGVLKYVMRYPSLTGSEAQVGVEGFGVKGGGSLGVGARGTWSAPLIEGTLAVRASLFAQETPGYIVNPLRGLNHENTLSQHGGRLAMLWQPTANLGVKLQAIYQSSHSGGDAIIFAQLLGTARDPYYRPGIWLGDLTYPHPVAEPFNSDITFIAGTLEWHTAFADLVCTTSFSDKGLSRIQDGSDFAYYLSPIPPTPVMLIRAHYDARVKRLAQEIRLASLTSRRIEWQAGLYYTHENASGGGYEEALDAQLSPIPGLNPYWEGHYPSTYIESTLFGTLTYRMTDRFDLTGGWRWSTDRQDVEVTIPPNYTMPAGHSSYDLTDNFGTYAFGARFHLQPEAMLYLRVASGARPSAVNGPPPPGYPYIPVQANSDAMVSYEVGAKSEVFSRKATLDFAAFKMNWTDMQVVIPTPDGKYSYWVNAGRVTSQGFEVATTYQPRDAIHLAANAAYTDAFATQAVPTASIFVGTRLPSSPKWTAAVMFDYRMRGLNGWVPDLSSTVRYISPQYSTLSTAPPVGLMPAYAWADLVLRVAKTRYEFSLYAKNLFDKRAFSYGGPAFSMLNATSAFAGSTIPPRTIGLAATLTL